MFTIIVIVVHDLFMICRNMFCCVMCSLQGVMHVSGANHYPRAAAFHARVRGSVPGLGGLKETKNCFFPIHV